MTPPSCEVEGCTTPPRRQNPSLCQRHATDAALGRPFRPPLRSPDTATVSSLSGLPLVLYLLRFTEEAGLGCLEWTGGADGAGYSCVSLVDEDGRHVRRVYRVILEALTGPIPPGYHVHHSCANPRCINPEHLERSDARANVGEMLERRGYVEYIRQLRDALAEYAPDHPLLASRVDGPGRD